jgi:bifunctional non-homologous end joining protein LigD
VRLTHPERLLWPDEGVTKADLFAYYERVAPVLVPHLHDRPFTMKRYRKGPFGDHFFQKDAPRGMPEWIPRAPFPTHPRGGGTRIVEFPLVNDELALLWMVQMGCVDMNAWLSRIDRPERPDVVLFDLDPPDGGFPLAVRAALLVRALLDELGLESHVKTSGADGIHVLVPIARRHDHHEVRRFAVAAGAVLEARHPELVTTEWRVEDRGGAVLVDTNQNGPGKTIASVYSVRPKPGAPVSTPLAWEELTEELDPRSLGMDEALARVDRLGDLHAPVLAGRQSLGRATGTLERGIARGGSLPHDA